MTIRMGAVCLCSTFLLLVPLRASAQAPDARATSMPDGTGKELVTTRCVTCHSLDTTLNMRATAGRWREIVDAMIDLGTKMTNEEAASLVSYLAERDGQAAPGDPSARSLAAGATARAPQFPAGPGRDVLMARCFQCHNDGMWKDLRMDRRGWDGVVYRMVGRGALWTDEDIRAMGEYLAKVLGRAAEKRP